jgi:hypothetical protein
LRQTFIEINLLSRPAARPHSPQDADILLCASGFQASLLSKHRVPNTGVIFNGYANEKVWQ